uniref:Integrase catalytic domain-containing protein n=1 Tax=Ascogregarina taiwanensis TaxID=158379 RepID=B3SRC0_ASCTA|nr:unknown [Ascogregarina taiwanensis]
MAKATSGKVQRWALYLQQFDLEIKHISGEKNVIADWLSRSVSEVDEFNDDEEIGIPIFTLEDEDTKSHLGSKMHGLVPYVPNYEDLRAGYETMPEEDKRMTFEASDQLRYSLRTNKLYVPPSCRELFMYWFHGSRYGGHCGVNKTVRRLNRWVWWPRAAQDVQEYVKQCLVCIRQAAPPKPIIIGNVLTRPLPLQLISVDLVGPRRWGIQEWYYLVIIDYCTRFLVAQATIEAPTTTWVIGVIQKHWTPVFQAPTAILADRGPQFRASEFQKFVTEELLAIMVYTSPYYPQRNAVNEASHRALDSLLAAMEKTFDKPFPSVLADAVAVHNSMPHMSTGQSPNFGMFGFELALPGWQKYQRDANQGGDRLRALQQERLKQIGRTRLEREDKARLVAKNVRPGDWVVYWLSKYEKGVGCTEGVDKYSSSWSLPAKVKEVKDGTCLVTCWGDPRAERQVPLAQIRILEGEIPATLQEINFKLLEKAEPRTIRHWSRREKTAEPARNWEEFLTTSAKLSQAKKVGKTEGDLKKKRRENKM